MIEVRAPLEHEMGLIRLVRHEVLDVPRGIAFEPADVPPEDLAPTTIHVAAFSQSVPVSTLRIEQHSDYGPYVRRMATLQSFAGLGIGRKVIAEAERQAAEQGMPRLKLHSRPGAENFYARCGFMQTGNYNEDEYGLYPEMVKYLPVKVAARTRTVNC